MAARLPPSSTPNSEFTGHSSTEHTPLLHDNDTRMRTSKSDRQAKPEPLRPSSPSVPNSSSPTPFPPSSLQPPPASLHRRRQYKWKWTWPPVIPNLNLRLENTGSVARDHLASERTFLAYVRTSLALASTGVALVQLFALSKVENGPGSSDGGTENPGVKYSRPLGAITVFLGLAVLVIGVTRYFTTQSALTLGRFPAARFTVAGVALALAALVVTVFSVLVADDHKDE